MKVILFSGYNDRAIICCCRFLEKNKIDYNIIAKSDEDKIFLTQYKNRVASTRNSPELTKEIILNSCRAVTKDDCFVVPSCEYLNRVLLSNEDYFTSQNITFGLCSQDVYSLVSDKYSFRSFCLDNGIQAPKEIKKGDFKYVIKPREYQSPEGEIKAPQLIDLAEAVPSDCYAEEFVEGESVYFLFYLSKKGDHRVFSQQNYLQQPEGGSILSAKSSFYHYDPIAKQIISILSKIKFFGLVMIEFRKTKNSWVMIEANPRLWGPMQLTVDSKMGLLEAFFKENLPDSEQIPELDPKKFIGFIDYFWSGGLTGRDVVHLGYEKSLVINQKNDIYNRDDTRELYYEESKKTI